MRIERLDLKAYGCMTNVSLDLAAAGRSMVVIYGQNEAGKSTILNAIRDWLFGFGRSVDDVGFLHNSAKLRIGGIISSGTEMLVAIRKKGNKDTLLAADGKTPLPDGAFGRFMKTITRDQFEQSFGLNLERLAAGGHDLAEGKGELGVALFTAASPIANLQRQRAEITRRKEDLFTVRASKPAINADLKTHADCKKEWEAKLVSADDAAQCDADVKKKQQSLEGLKGREITLRNDLRQRVRLEESLALVLKYDDLKRERTPFQHIPPLRSSFAADCARVSPDLRQAETLLKGIDDELQRLEKELGETIVDVRILTVADMVRDLSGQQQSINGDTRELAADEQLLRNKLGEAKQALRGLGLPIEDVERFVDALRLSDRERKQLQKLATDHVKLSESLKGIGQRYAEHEREASDAVRRLEVIPATPQMDVLEIAIEVSRGADPEVQAKTLGSEITKLIAEIAAELKRLGCGKAIEEIQAVPIPSLEVIEDYRQRFEESERESRNLREKRREIEDEQSRAKHDLAKAETSGSIPRLDELPIARKHRDVGWRLISQAWLSGTWDTGTAAEFGGGEAEPAGVARTYESAVSASDDIADRLAAEADRVRARLELELRIQSLSERLARLGEDAVRTTAAFASLQMEWQAIWESTATLPQNPRQMAAWRQSWDKLRERVRQLYDKRTELTWAQEAQASLADRIRRALRVTGENETTLAGITGTAELVAFATRALKKLEKAAEERRLGEGTVAATKADLETAEAQRVEKRNDLTAWEHEWKKATARLTAAGLTDMPAEHLNDVLDGIDEFHEHMKFRRGREIERKKRQTNVALWHTELASVADQLDERDALREAADPALLIDSWTERVRVEETIRNRRADRTTRREELQRRRPESQAECEANTSRMAGLLREAQVDTLDALPQRISDADQLRDIDRRIETEYREPIRKLAAGAGCNVEEVERLAAGAIGRELQSEADDIGQKLAELDEQKVQAAKELGEALQKQTELLNRRGGIDERERMEATLARIRHHVPDYAALVLAEAVLSKAIERYRAKHKTDLFESASRLFHRLTCGRFVRLDIDQDDSDCQYLVGIRPDGKMPDRVRLDGMSDGTCDQLYLALRLAHLEKHVTDHGPFPIIVDDILLSFDDSRARAALQCLADLGSKTQVLFFTHHRHLRDMARELEFQGQIGILDMDVGTEGIGKDSDEK